MMATATANMDTRYTFTAQFLRSSAMFARRCAEIESINPANPDDPMRTEHLGLVTAVIMQSVAAVEAQSAELTLHGPGAHLGSDKVDAKGQDFLKPLAKFIDRQEVMDRYALILHVLGKPPLNKGKKICQHMATLVSVRNELVHYKSQWGEEMSRRDLFKTLRGLQLAKPPFVSSNMNFFPYQFMSAACAEWSVHTAVNFLDAVYERLDIESPLNAYRHDFI